MKANVFLVAMLLIAMPAISQVPYNAAVPNGYTKKAMVAEQVGLTQVSITYHRPAVSGREGKIWGQVVHKGFVNQGFGNNNPAPWRAGANETTTIEFDQDVKIEGQPLAKGKYGLYIAYDAGESTVIFSRRYESWGSFFYDQADDALRVKVIPVVLDKSVEHLRYDFSGQTQNSAVISVAWEKVAIPFKVEVDYLKQQFNAFMAESQNPRGFTSQGLTIAANWALQNNYQLEQALVWAGAASGATFPGDASSFSAVSTKAVILYKLGKSDEATAAMKNALQLGNIGQLQQFGRQLITTKNPKAALEVFEFNHTKNPNQLITLTGMARGLSANGDYAKAQEFAEKALPLAPNDANRQAIQAMIDKLKEKKDIN